MGGLVVCCEKEHSVKKLTERRRFSSSFGPEFLFIVPILGYALAYAYEVGAYLIADAPSALIVISIPHIFVACFSVLVPLSGAAYATSGSSRKLIDRGWRGVFFVLLAPLLGYGPMIVFGFWKDEATVLYVAIASLFGFSSVVFAYAMQKSLWLRGFFEDFIPPVRDLLAIGALTVMAVGLAGIAGAASERSQGSYTVLDDGCLAYTRVFRMAGDTIIMFPAHRGVGRGYEVSSLSNQGKLRMKAVTKDEYFAGLAMAGPCAKTLR